MVPATAPPTGGFAALVFTIINLIRISKRRKFRARWMIAGCPELNRSEWRWSPSQTEDRASRDLIPAYIWATVIGTYVLLIIGMIATVTLISYDRPAVAAAYSAPVDVQEVRVIRAAPKPASPPPWKFPRLWPTSSQRRPLSRRSRLMSPRQHHCQMIPPHRRRPSSLCLPHCRSPRRPRCPHPNKGPLGLPFTTAQIVPPRRAQAVARMCLSQDP
jgi:hypothetical protein